MKRRHLILLLGGASSGAMSVGTGAFTSAEAGRSVAVNVVDDEDAYLGLDVENETGVIGRPAEVVAITNSFAADLSLDVSVEETNEVVEGVAVGDESPDESFSLELSPGEGELISVTCGRLGEASFTLRFDGETDRASVEKTRTFDAVHCRVSGVEFNGRNGSAVVAGEFTELDVRIVFESGTTVDRTISSNPNGRVLHPRESGNGGRDSIEQVVIGSVVYERPETPSNGAGNESGSDGD
ncbi:hypothetical protein [Halorubrum sp. HHNYT27]|uniref:hypothetical protein n=1 Tax=Halorubrum sp. HHNYT27 TaxID=3402275 RepID=UPI003EC0638B